MSEPFLGQISLFGFNFAPRGFALCDGQILPISQNQSLFALLGTTYGGDGRTTFGLPDLRSRAPMHFGSGVNLGQQDGAERVSLTEAQMPAHTHTAQATNQTPAGMIQQGTLLTRTDSGRGAITPYADAAALTSLHPGSISNGGANQGHENMQPFLTLSFAIALQGVFPSRN